jgi:excisionase family DNA binding protein
MPDNSDIMRPQEAAKYLTLSVQRLAKLRLEGGGPTFIKAGRSVLYRRADLDLWLRSRTRNSTSDGGPDTLAVSDLGTAHA